jgi:8-oxo-dGTP diphosphatase
MLACNGIRTFAAAYILWGDFWLMLKRSPTHTLFPNTWAPVGGHVEVQDKCNPINTVWRELKEEANLSPGDVTDLKLKYITLRIKGQELRQLYLFFGQTERASFDHCREGELHLVHKSQVLLRPLGTVNKLTLEYHFAAGEAQTDVMVGVVNVAGGLPAVTWVPLQDWGADPE